MITPIERLAAHLHDLSLTIYDVSLSPKPGYIVIKSNGESLNIQGVGYSPRKGVSINQLWMDLHDYFNSNVEVEKVRKSGLVTVIHWNGQRYSFDKNRKRKDDTV